ncbi:hypothetical protein [Bacillus rubiinfantis]|uniref:hypothetical protein n=1 Tax=Bacillus rubiinfantis TaxID=1499680 RepID=UPI000A8E36DE|nr:hypothetical protein [Bacillus rubiinfantis]
MPRGKELEGLPMTNTLPGAGKNPGDYEREVLGTITQTDQPQPSSIRNANKEKM